MTDCPLDALFAVLTHAPYGSEEILDAVETLCDHGREDEASSVLVDRERREIDDLRVEAPWVFRDDKPIEEETIRKKRRPNDYRMATCHGCGIPFPSQGRHAKWCCGCRKRKVNKVRA